MNIPAGYKPSDLEIPSSSEFVPPESFWLSKDSEHDWFDRNAYLERKESTKGNNKPYSRSNSQKFSVSVKSKPAIIGLPKTQKNTHVESNRRACKQANVRLFPKRSTSGGRAITEPSSPKVSCIGRVRSKRCPNRNKKQVEPEEKIANSNKNKNINNLVSRITSLFRSDRNKGKGKGKTVKVKELMENSYSRRSNVMVKPVNSEPETPPEPPVLGGMNRFASGRRSEAWSEDIEGAGSR